MTDAYTNGKSSSENPRRRRTPKKATPERLEKAALFYLERYASSSENLRRVLMRRVERSARIHGGDREENAAAVDAIIARFLKAGLLDDQSFAQARAASLHRRGASMRAIRMKLSEKGVDAATAEKALETLADDLALDGEADPDLTSAINYARRRRIGPYRTGPYRNGDREEYKQRDLAALGRQGFSYDIAKRVIDAETPNDILL